MSDIDPHVFEIIMLICFGASWPFVLAKTIRTKAVSGKSIVFLVLVVIGYLSGVISKLMGEPDYVIWFYVINSSMVITEMVFYFRYRRTDEHRDVQGFTPLSDPHGIYDPPLGYQRAASD